MSEAEGAVQANHRPPRTQVASTATANGLVMYADLSSLRVKAGVAGNVQAHGEGEAAPI
jgi:hypothetical protein